MNFPTPGSLLLRYKQKFGHGFRVAHYRDNVRRRILKTKPVEGLHSDLCEIHVLTSETDWLNLLWALKSFYTFSGRDYRLCIHEDGSLTANSADVLQSHFPDCRILLRRDVDAEILDQLSGHPQCQKVRKERIISVKEFDFPYYSLADRIMLLDSDVLFFANPVDLLKRIEDPGYRLNCVNGDVETAYSISPQEAKKYAGVDLIERFNSGLGLVHKEALNWDWVEEFITVIPGLLENHIWRFEQTLCALCCCRHGAELLPSAFDVHLEGAVGSSPCRHYVGAIRHLMYGEGMRMLSKGGFLKKLTF